MNNLPGRSVNDSAFWLQCLSGIWRATLDPVEAGGPYVLTASQSTTNSSITLTDVLFGDIWLCSGQSNMAFTVGQVSKLLLKLTSFRCVVKGVVHF